MQSNWSIHYISQSLRALLIKVANLVMLWEHVQIPPQIHVSSESEPVNKQCSFLMLDLLPIGMFSQDTSIPISC